MSITKKTHINPCFWSALWNNDYFEKFMMGKEHLSRARDQKVHFLEINSDKALEDRTENVHYEKYLGVAEMTPDALLDFCKRNHPDKYDSFAKEMEENPETLYLDFENVFSKLEELPIYKVLLKTIRDGHISTQEEKTWMALFLTHHVLRSHVYINSLTDAYNEEGMEKFEALLKLRWSLEDPRFMALETLQLIERRWTIFNLERKILPLSDGPIVGTPSGVLFATLAPNKLLTVEPKTGIGLGVAYESRVPASTYTRYMRGTINNTHKGLVFAEKKDLLKWQSSIWWKRRRAFTI